jgi:hypothetical protein
MKNYCGSCKHMRAVDGKQNLQFHWPNSGIYIADNRKYATTGNNCNWLIF